MQTTYHHIGLVTHHSNVENVQLVFAFLTHTNKKHDFIATGNHKRIPQQNLKNAKEAFCCKVSSI